MTRTDVMWTILLLLLFYCTSVHTRKPEDCLLYPVKKSASSSWDLESGEVTEIRLTTEAQPGVTRVEARDQCLLSLHYDPDTLHVPVTTHNHNTYHYPSDPTSDCLFVFNNTDEVRVAVLSVKEAVMVWMEGIGLWREVANIPQSSSSPAIKVTTTNFVNVGFKCKEGCFQLRNTILGKSFKSQLAGSLVFRGKISDQGENERKIESVFLRRGRYDWKRKNFLKLTPALFNKDNWTDFNVTATFMKSTRDDESCKDIFKVSATRKTVEGTSNKFLSRACILAPRLILSFNHTNNIEWSVCTSKTRPSNFVPATTPSSATTQTMVIVLGAVGVVCLLLVLVLAATCVCLQRVRRKIQKHHPQPLSTTAITHPPAPVSPGSNHLDIHPPIVPSPLVGRSEEEEDPANHVYDYVDLTQINPSNGEELVSSRNSLYGCVIDRSEA